MNHNKYKATKHYKEFFDYSFFELGKYDAPAQIDFVRHKTGQDKVTWIGHSQGTTQMFTALAENFGGMRDKINLFVALCPITNLGFSNHGIMGYASTSAGYSSLAKTLSSFSIHELKGPKWKYL